MGNVLNRKLFRHKAQVKQKKVPNYYLGGLFQLGARGLPYLTGFSAGMTRSGLGRAVAPVASRIKSGASNVAGQVSQILPNRPNIPNILKDNRLYRIGKKGIGAAELAYPVGMAGSGTVNFMQGDYEQALEDFGLAGIAYPFMAQGAQMVKPGGRLAKEAIRLTPRTIRRNPFKSALGIGALTMAPGMLFAEDQQDQISKIDANPDLTTEQKNSEKSRILGRPLTASELGLEVPFLDDDVNQADIVSTLDEASKVTKEKVEKTNIVNNQINEAVQNDEQVIVGKDDKGEPKVDKKSDPEKYQNILEGKEGPIAQENQNIADAKYGSYMGSGLITNSNNPRGDLSLANNTDIPEIINLGSADVLSKLLSKTKVDFKKSYDFVDAYEKKMDARDKEKRKNFDQYKKMYQEMTGDTGNNYRNYALLKWASRMMSGKTTQTGLSGFMDVLGQSTEGLAQDVMAIDMHEKAKSKALADGYLNYISALDQEFNKTQKEIFAQQIGIANTEIRTEAQTRDQQLNRASNIYTAQIKAKNALDVANAKAQATLASTRYKFNKDPEYRIIPNKFLQENPALQGIVKPSWAGESLLRVYTNANNANMRFVDVGGRYVQLPPNFDLNQFETASFDQGRQNELKDRMSAANKMMGLVDLFNQVNTATGGKLIGLDGKLRVIDGILESTAKAIPVVGKFLGGAYETASDFLSDDVEDYLFDVSEEANAKFLAEAKRNMEPDAFENYKNKYYEVVKNSKDSAYIESMLADGASDAEKRGLSTMLVIESRAAYLLARMNKLRDRISNSDTENAEKRTGIIKAFIDKELIPTNYISLKNEAKGIFGEVSKEYIRAGGDPRALAAIYDSNELVVQQTDALKNSLNKNQPITDQSKQDAIQGLEGTFQ